MEFEEIEFILSPNTRKMASYGKTSKEYLETVNAAIECVLELASKQVKRKPKTILGKSTMGSCSCCQNIVYSSENYCSRCGVKLQW